jgi:cytoskeletal protein RodZ
MSVNAAIHLSKLLPSPHGFLEWFFLLVLLGLLGAVGVFAAFLAVQQVRNPGRSSRRH